MRQSRPPLVRMQYMHQQLRSNHYPNCSRVAEYFDVSTKSIQRDVDYMRDLLHAPIEYDQKKREAIITRNPVGIFCPQPFLSEGRQRR